MAKKRMSIRVNAGTAWFLAILLIAAIAAVMQGAVSENIIWLVLAICGAMVAVYNIRLDEENSFLVSIAALFIVLISWSLTGIFGQLQNEMLFNFLINLMVGLGVAGFIVAIASIFKIAIEK